MTALPVGSRAAAVRTTKVRETPPPGVRGRGWMALLFLAPALVMIGAIVVYPTLDTIVQSFQSDLDRQFIGLANYERVLSSGRVLTALRNNAIWVATAPAIITGLGLVFAVLTERVRYATAVKIVVFMPMAISFLATGVIWRLMYDPSPDRGLVNAGIGVAYDAVKGPGPYTGARARPDGPVEVRGGELVLREPVRPGGVAAIGLIAVPARAVPDDAKEAVLPQGEPGAVSVVVWRDFKPGGGEPGRVDDGESGLPGATVVLRDAAGRQVASAKTGDDGVATFRPDGAGPFTAAVAAATFSPGYRGIDWLGPSLVTPAIIGAFCWMWAGFAVVVIGAGLSALPRDVLEAARVDGATEWQVFRRVTLPLLGPVLGVVFVTMVINVLKIFDIVLVTAPGATQDEANVIALDMWKTAFSGQQYGEGSAIAVLLFLLVVPVMVFNLRRIARRES